jgi:hypothetical protein
MNKFVEYLNWCRRMYDENCIERSRHGQQPYSTFDDYYNTNKDWLRQEYENADRLVRV